MQLTGRNKITVIAADAITMHGANRTWDPMGQLPSLLNEDNIENLCWIYVITLTGILTQLDSTNRLN